MCFNDLYINKFRLPVYSFRNSTWTVLVSLSIPGTNQKKRECTDVATKSQLFPKSGVTYSCKNTTTSSKSQLTFFCNSSK